MQSNCYVCYDDQENAIVIDPGDDANTISEYLLTNQLNPLAIIATHGHFDHVMATLELQLAFNIPFYIHKKDEFLLKRMRETVRHYQNTDPGPPPKPDFYLEDKAELRFSDFLVFKTIEIPGHTPGSVALVNKSEGLIFVGDLVFAGGSVGRTDFKYANKQTLKKSLQKVLKLPGEYIVYSGHGLETDVGSLRGTLW